MTNSPNHPTLADLERLVNDLALMPDEQNKSDLTPVGIMPKTRSRKQYKFWLDVNQGGDLALCQYLNTLKNNRKFKTFINLALRYAIVDYSTRKHHNNGEPNVPFEYLDDIQADIEWLLDNLNWSKE